MSFLKMAGKPKVKPPMITVVGSPGAGKTTLGALFPNAIILPTEDGTAVFENWDEEKQPDVLPRLPKAAKDETGKLVRSSRETLNSIVDELMTADHQYKTFVIDSITTLAGLFEHEITLRDNVKTVGDASGGWHKGFDEVASWHADFIYKCEQLRAVKGMAVVFLAHIGVKKIRNSPDAAADYSIYSMGMDSKASSAYIAQSDAVVYLVSDKFVSGAQTDKRGNVTRTGVISDSGQRKLVTSGDGRVGYTDAKNRYGMPAEMPVVHGDNPLIPFFKFYQQGE